MLTQQELEKYKNCLFMESVAPKKEEWTDDLDEQVKFVRTYGKGKISFYTVNWYKSNPRRTMAIYAEVHKQYMKAFNIRNKKYINARKKKEELEAKILQQTEINA